MEFDLENPLSFSKEEEMLPDSISALFSAESHYITSQEEKSPDLSIRQAAISLILRAQLSGNLDSIVPYLAINYLDRYLSRREIPREKPWIVPLLSASCLSLAAKMKNVIFSTADLPREGGFVFGDWTIGRMELLVIGALEWRMRSITPFAFLRFFLSFFSPADPQFLHTLKCRASEIFFVVQNEMAEVMEFKPSVIAASVILSAAREIFPVQFPAFRSAVCSCEFVNKEELESCNVTREEVETEYSPAEEQRRVSSSGSCSPA